MISVKEFKVEIFCVSEVSTLLLVLVHTFLRPFSFFLKPSKCVKYNFFPVVCVLHTLMLTWRHSAFTHRRSVTIDDNHTNI